MKKKERKAYFYRFLSLWNNFVIIIILLWEAFFSAWQKDSRCPTCQQSHVAVLFRFRSVSLNLMKCKLLWNPHTCCWWRKPLTKLGNKIYRRYIFTLTLMKLLSPPHPTPWYKAELKIGYDGLQNERICLRDNCLKMGLLMLFNKG